MLAKLIHPIAPNLLLLATGIRTRATLATLHIATRHAETADEIYCLR